MQGIETLGKSNYEGRNEEEVTRRIADARASIEKIRSDLQELGVDPEYTVEQWDPEWVETWIWDEEEGYSPPN